MATQFNKKQRNDEFFKQEFDKHAVNGAIGNPNGQPAYAYLRVSSSGQAEEGRSGIPRQIEHIHEIAAEQGYKITWDRVFADDHSGFEFVDRPALTALRNKYHDPSVRTVIIENLDRLSRHATWQQGWLLEEMQKAGLKPVFWKPLRSRIEQAVVGAIAEEGMKDALARMKDGIRKKAQSGRITAPRSAYGYKKVDSHGETSMASRRDTHYAIVEREADVVRAIFNRVANRAQSLQSLVEWLDKLYPPPSRHSTGWSRATVHKIIHNPVYKGEFVAHRHKRTKVERLNKDGSVQYISRTEYRPKEEWIIVQVPPIVSPQLWQAANDTLQKNKRTSPRNSKELFLLTGLLRCAHCGYAMILRKSGMNRSGHKGKRAQRYYYTCTMRVGGSLTRKQKEQVGCTNGTISARVIEAAVWNAILKILLEPERITGVIDQRIANNVPHLKQLEYIDQQIADKDTESNKLYKAYLAGGFDADEFAEMKLAIKHQRQVLLDERAVIQARIVSPEQIVYQKEQLLAISDMARHSGLCEDQSFESKRAIIHTVVNRIMVDTKNGWLVLDGALSGVFQIGEYVSTFANKRYCGG